LPPVKTYGKTSVDFPEICVIIIYMTLTQIKNARFRFLRDAKPVFRKMDTGVEAAERELARIIKRKRSLPENADLARLTALLRTTEEAVKEAQRYIKGGFKD